VSVRHARALGVVLLLTAALGVQPAHADNPAPAPLAASPAPVPSPVATELAVTASQRPPGRNAISVMGRNAGPRPRQRAKIRIEARAGASIRWRCPATTRCSIATRRPGTTVVDVTLLRGQSMRVTGRVAGARGTRVIAAIRPVRGYDATDHDNVAKLILSRRDPARPTAPSAQERERRGPASARRGSPLPGLLLGVVALAALACLGAMLRRRRPPALAEPRPSSPRTHAPHRPDRPAPATTWNLWALERDAHARSLDVEQRELLFQLREVAALDGGVPVRYATMLDDAFGAPGARTGGMRR
jgi:hypothetical protein